MEVAGHAQRMRFAVITSHTKFFDSDGKAGGSQPLHWGASPSNPRSNVPY